MHRLWFVGLALVGCYDAGRPANCTVACATGFCPSGLECNSEGMCSVGRASCGITDAEIVADSGDAAVCASECDTPRPIPVVPALAPPGAKTLYVDPDDGNDVMNCQSPQTPCKTLGSAISKISTGVGDVVLLAGSTYTTGSDDAVLLLGPAASGRLERPTVIRDWPGRGTGRPILSGVGATQFGIKICCGAQSARHIVIAGLQIQGTTIAGVQVHGPSATGNAIVDTIITQIGAGGVPTADSGIQVASGASNTVLYRNEIMMSGDGNVQFIGIRIGADTEHVELLSNVIHDNLGNAMHINHGDVVVHSNTIFRNRTGIQIAYELDGSALVCRNTIFMNAGDGIVVDGNARVFYNTVHDNTEDGIDVESGTSVVLANNLITDNDACGVDAGDVPIDPIDHHNLYFGNSPATCQLEPDGNTDLLESDPQYTNAANADFTLQSSSPARGAGECGSTLGALP